MSNKISFHVTGQDPISAVAALYSNFVGISRVGTDVQLEFVFLDLNQVAVALEQAKSAKKTDEELKLPLNGKTIAKIVMPGACFLQLRSHLDQLFAALDQALKEGEVEHDRNRAESL